MNLSVLIFSMGVVDRHIDRWDLDYIKKKMLLTEEQKGCRRKCNGTVDLVLIAKMRPREVRMRKKNLTVTRINCKKAYGIVSHTWIVECLGVVWWMNKSFTFWKYEIMKGEFIM